MNYEELYGALQPLEKSLKDSAAAGTRQQKSIQKNTETGNLTEVKKSLEAIADATKTLQEGIDAVRDKIEAFDTKAYFERSVAESCIERFLFIYEIDFETQGESLGWLSFML